MKVPADLGFLNPLTFMTLRLLPLLGMFVCCSCLGQSALPVEVAHELKLAGVAESAMSAVVLPANAAASGVGARMQHLASESRAPGSTMKLVTTLVALEELGPAYRWSTQLFGTAAIDGARLKGPIYLKGSGDPDFTWDRLRSLLRELRNQGVRHIVGDLVLDRSLFQPERPDIDAPAFDETPDAYYNVIPDALLLGSNLIEFSGQPTEAGLRLHMSPPLDRVLLSRQFTFNDTRCDDWETEWDRRNVQPQRNGQIHITLSGELPRGCRFNVGLNLLERNLYIERFVRAFWKELGGSWRGVAKDGHVPYAAKLLLEARSGTLADVVKRINKPSDNAMARMLFLTLGATSTAEPANTDTRIRAQARVQYWLQTRNLSTEGLVLDNGSGLSRTERISATQMAEVLKAGARSRWYPEFAASLPIAAIDGTMRRRLRDTPVGSGQARIKTGTLRDVVAIAGYVQDTTGSNWIVVGMINDPAAKKARPALDALIRWAGSGPVAP